MLIDRHSPSSLNLFAAAPAMWVLERLLGVKQPVGVPAHRGVAVETGVALGLADINADLKQCADAALIKYDYLAALSPDPRKAKYRETIPEMVQQALAELRHYGAPSKMQSFIEWKPAGLKLPIVGYYDFYWENTASHLVIDLKTTEKMPSEIKVSHARQVAFYAMSDNMDAKLCYVTPKKCQVMQLENIREHREALYQIALRLEKFLALSDDPGYFLSITVPDLESFYWNTPAARQLAWEHWRV